MLTIINHNIYTSKRNLPACADLDSFVSIRIQITYRNYIVLEALLQEKNVEKLK